MSKTNWQIHIFASILFFLNLSCTDGRLVVNTSNLASMWGDPVSGNICLNSNAAVKAITRAPQFLVLGGDFTSAGTCADRQAFLAQDGKMSPGPQNFPRHIIKQINSSDPTKVRAVIPDGSGGWYIGGDFTIADTLSFVHTNLIHILPESGSINTNFKPVIDGFVSLIVKKNDGLIIGGDFLTVNGAARKFLAKIDLDIGVETSGDWHNTPIFDATASEPKFAYDQLRNFIYVTYNTSSPGTNYTVIRVMDPGVKDSWFLNVISGAVVNTIAATEDHIAFVKDGISIEIFNTLSSSPMGSISSTDPGLNFSSITFIGRNLHMAGSFINMESSPVGTTSSFSSSLNYASVNIDTMSFRYFDPSPDQLPVKIFAINNEIYTTGYFSMMNKIRPNGSNYNLSSERLLIYDNKDNRFVSMETGLDAPVNALIHDSRYIYLGGGFTLMNTMVTSTPTIEPRSRIAAIDYIDKKISSWNPSASGEVFALAQDQKFIYVGGVNGVEIFSKPGVAESPPLLPPGLSISGTVYSLIRHQDTLYIAGSFSASVGGNIYKGLLAIDKITTAPTLRQNFFEVDGTGFIKVAKIWNNRIIVAGDMSVVREYVVIDGTKTIAPSPIGVSRITTYNLDTNSIQIDWLPFVSGYINAMDVIGNKLYIGGSFTTVGTTAFTHRLAALPLDSMDYSLTSSWDPPLTGASMNIEVIHASVTGNIHIGGKFDYYGAIGSQRLKRGYVVVDPVSGVTMVAQFLQKTMEFFDLRKFIKPKSVLIASL